MADINKLIAEAFPTAELGGIKLIHCLDARYICRYHNAERVPGGSCGWLYYVPFETINMFRGNKIMTYATWDVREFKWSKAKALHLIRERVIRAIKALKEAHEEEEIRRRTVDDEH